MIVDGEPRHLYLPGPRRGVVVPQVARTSKELIVTEGILDGMSLWDCGYTNILPCWGVTGWTDSHRELVRREQVREIYICFDGDEAGREGAGRLGEELRREGVRAVVVSLPEGKDINDVVRTGGTAAVEALLRAADPGVAERPSFPFHRSHHGYEKTAGGFRLNLSGRVYEVKGMGRSPTHLRCAVRASLGPAALGTPGLPTHPATPAASPHPSQTYGARFHLDTLDLYNAKSRQAWVRACAGLFGIDAGTTEHDLRRVIEYAEAETETQTSEEPGAGLLATPDEEAEALAFLRRPDLLDQVVRDLDLAGYAGEEANKLLGYLACVSRKLDEPLSLFDPVAVGSGEIVAGRRAGAAGAARGCAAVHAGHRPGALLPRRGRAGAQDLSTPEEIAVAAKRIGLGVEP